MRVANCQEVSLAFLPPLLSPGTNQWLLDPLDVAVPHIPRDPADFISYLYTLFEIIIFRTMLERAAISLLVILFLPAQLGWSV